MSESGEHQINLPRITPLYPPPLWAEDEEPTLRNVEPPPPDDAA